MKYIQLAAAFLFVGCSSTPTTQIAAFGNSTSEITQLVDSVMDEYNNASLERNFTDYAASYTGDHSDLLTSSELAKIQKPIKPEQRKIFAIYRANRALGEYAKALSSLATASSPVDIDIAAARLYGAMVSLSDQYKILRGTDREIFNDENLAKASVLISAIGGAVVEEKRRSAIQGIVVDADPNVALLCDEINNQLNIARIEDSIAASRQYILVEELIDYKAQVKEKTTLDWRRSELKRLYNLQQGVFNSKLLVQKTKTAIREVKHAHAILADELKQGRYSSAAIASSIGRLRELVRHYDDFEGFLLNCRRITKNEMGILSCEDE